MPVSKYYPAANPYLPPFLRNFPPSRPYSIQPTSPLSPPNIKVAPLLQCKEGVVVAAASTKRHLPSVLHSWTCSRGKYRAASSLAGMNCVDSEPAPSSIETCMWIRVTMMR